MSFSNEKFVSLIKKNPISIGCALVTVALLATAYFRSDLADKAKTELDEKSTEADRLALNLKNAVQLKEHVDALVSAEKDINARMIHAGQLTTNRQYFYKLESELGVKLLDLRPSGSAKKDAKNYVPTIFTVNVQGDYRQLLSFLRQLENGVHYCRVLSATCNVPPDRGTTLVLNINLELLGLP